MSATSSSALPLRRYAFITGAATLLVVLVSWVAVRAVGPAEADNRVPLMVQPTVPPTGAAPPVPPAPSSAPARTPSKEPSGTPSAVPTTAATTTPTATAKATSSKPKPSRTTPPPAPVLSWTAQYRSGEHSNRGFAAKVEVTNTSGPARNWTVRVSFDPASGVQIRNTRNAEVDQQGNTFVFTGGPLAPGATVVLGFEASKQPKTKFWPTGCAIDGAACLMS